MFKVGDLIIYSSQGICRIEDICEQTFLGETKDYYILYPVESPGLKISTPIDNDKVTMMELISNKEEAYEILDTFKYPGIEWIENASHRIQQYSEIVKKGNRKEISKIASTLIRRKYEAEIKGKKIYEQDNNLLNNIINILFSEVAIALHTTFEDINERITSLIIEDMENSTFKESRKDVEK